MRRRNYLFVLGILIGIVVLSGLNLGKKDQLTTIKSASQNSSSNESFRDYEILPKTSDMGCSIIVRHTTYKSLTFLMFYCGLIIVDIVAFLERDLI